MSNIISKSMKEEATACSIYEFFNKKEKRLKIKELEKNVYKTKTQNYLFLSIFSTACISITYSTLDKMPEILQTGAITGGILITSIFATKAFLNYVRKSSLEQNKGYLYNLTQNKHFDQITHSINYAFRTGQYDQVCNIAKQNLTTQSFIKSTEKTNDFINRMQIVKDKLESKKAKKPVA